MGKIRTENIKRLSRMVVAYYYDYLTEDFEHNKKVVNEVLYLKYGGRVSKRLRNRVAGYVTRLVKRIKRKPDLLKEIQAQVMGGKAIPVEEGE